MINYRRAQRMRQFSISELPLSRHLILLLNSSTAQKIKASSLEVSYLRPKKDYVLIYTVTLDTKVLTLGFFGTKWY